MHMQVFEYLNERFPAMPLEYGYSRKARRAEEASTPIANLTSGVEPGHEHHSHNRGSNQFINGAQGGIGSDYFAGCWKEHLGEDVDLVIVELGINDARSLEAMENYELLLRSLLEMGSRPAVINVQ
jgi:lysophospholipase L1-like esterase